MTSILYRQIPCYQQQRRKPSPSVNILSELFNIWWFRRHKAAEREKTAKEEEYKKFEGGAGPPEKDLIYRNWNSLQTPLWWCRNKETCTKTHCFVSIERHLYIYIVLCIKLIKYTVYIVIYNLCPHDGAVALNSFNQTQNKLWFCSYIGQIICKNLNKLWYQTIIDDTGSFVIYSQDCNLTCVW